MFRRPNKETIMKTDQSQVLKVVLVGDGGVGKSSLMNRYITGKYDGQSYHSIVNLGYIIAGHHHDYVEVMYYSRLQLNFNVALRLFDSESSIGSEDACDVQIRRNGGHTTKVYPKKYVENWKKVWSVFDLKLL